jgi:hypothetical protein
LIDLAELSRAGANAEVVENHRNIEYVRVFLAHDVGN